MHTREVIGKLDITGSVRRKLGKRCLEGNIRDGPKDIITYFFVKPERASRTKAGAKTGGAGGQQKADEVKDGPPKAQSSGPVPKPSPAGCKKNKKEQPDEPQSDLKDAELTDAKELPDNQEQLDVLSSDSEPEEEHFGKSPEDLKKEACSLRHLLTHIPKNPYCPACQKAKGQRRGARRVKIRCVRVTPKKFGDEVTCDHWIARNDLSRGLHGESVALTFRDRATRWIECCGLKTNSVEMTLKALRYIQGMADIIRYVYSDGAEEITQAADKLEAISDTSIPENLSLIHI